MAELVTPPGQGLLRTIADLERRMRILERMPSGLESIGTQHLAPVPAARVYRNAALNHTATGTFQTVAFDTVDHDTTGGGMWVVGQPTRLTATRSGIHRMTGRAVWSASAVGVRAVQVMLNGTTPLDQEDEPGPTAADGGGQGIHTTVAMASGDYIELLGFQNTGGNFAYAVGRHFLHLSLEWVGNQ